MSTITPSGSQRSSHPRAPPREKTWPLIKRQFLSILAMASMSSSVSGSDTVHLILARYLPVNRKWYKGLDLAGRPLYAHSRRVYTQPFGDSHNHWILDIHGILRSSVSIRLVGAAQRDKSRWGLYSYLSRTGKSSGCSKMGMQLHLVEASLMQASLSSSLSLGIVICDVPHMSYTAPIPPGVPSPAGSPCHSSWEWGSSIGVPFIRS